MIQVCVYYSVVSLLTVTPFMEMTIINIYKGCGTQIFDPALNYGMHKAFFPSHS